MNTDTNPRRVRAVIIESDRVLVLERNRNNEHYYVFPGGGVEKGESDKEALKREMMEETSIEIEVGKKIYTDNYLNNEIDFYLCTIVSGEVAKGSGPEYTGNDKYENTIEPKWINLTELNNIDLRPVELRDKIYAQ